MDRIKIGFNFSFDINAPKSTETEYQELQNILGRLTENKSPFLKKKQPTKYQKKKKWAQKKKTTSKKTYWSQQSYTGLPQKYLLWIKIVNRLTMKGTQKNNRKQQVK